MFSGALQLEAQDVRETSTTKQHPLGTRGFTNDGKVYRYAKAGATALDPGKLCVNADLDTNVTNKTVARTTAAGATSVIVDAAGTVVQDAYVDGTFTINDATGEGINYRVTGNTGVTGAGEITVFLATPLKVALTIDVSEYTLSVNPWDTVVISATDQADMPVGIPNVTVAIGSYAWLQTRGSCAGWADEAVAKGLALTIGTGTAGAIEALDAAGEFQIGVAPEALVDTEFHSVFLTLD